MALDVFPPQELFADPESVFGAVLARAATGDVAASSDTDDVRLSTSRCQVEKPYGRSTSFAWIRAAAAGIEGLAVASGFDVVDVFRRRGTVGDQRRAIGPHMRLFAACCPPVVRASA